jgi:hypothetical protein
VKTSNGQVEQFPYTLGDLRRDNPQTSFPKKIGDAILASYGIFHVMPETQPEHDPLVQTVVRDPAPHNNETAVNEETGETYKTGRWVIGYTVENKRTGQPLWTALFPQRWLPIAKHFVTCRRKRGFPTL